MSAAKYYADIHCHSTVIPYNQSKNMWNYKPPTKRQRRKGHEIWDNVARPYTQGDLVTLTKGKVKVVFVSLYPVEWGLLTVVRKPVLNQGFFKAIWEIIICSLRLALQILARYTWVGRLLSTYPTWRVRQILRYDRSYFDDLRKEYKKLYQDKDCPAWAAIEYGIPSDSRVKIVSDFNEIEDILNDPLQENTTAVVLTTEGAHSMGSGQKNTLKGLPDGELDNPSNPKTQALTQALISDIHELKQWGPPGEPGAHTPFLITFGHHFWNQLCGHAMSQAGFLNKLFDQRRGMAQGLTGVGKTIVREFLTAANGKRILLDAKHMSIDTRLWYYDRVAAHNTGKPDKKKIPVIVSHAGVNGIATMDESRNPPTHKEADKKYKKSNSIFNIWDINLSDEEIKKVHDSNGLVGIILDQRILAGKKLNDKLNHLPCKVRRNMDLLRREWVVPFLNNVLHIARVIYDYTGGNLPAGKTIWDNIAFGSDFDGRINALDPFCTAEDCSALEDVLTRKLIEVRDSGTEEFLTGKSDAEIAGIVRRLMFGNVMNFMKMYFKDEYLTDPLEVDSFFV